MDRDYFLEFDEATSYGSREHFHHFLLGYLLPALHEAIRIETRGAPSQHDRKYLTRSCGPLMDPVAAEMFALHGLTHETLPADRPWKGTSVLAPRWDSDLLALSRRQASTEKAPLKSRLKEPIKRLLGRSPANFLARARRVRAKTLDRLEQSGTDFSNGPFAGRYLLIKRSPPADFYKEDGPAKIAHYGTGRRALRGVDEAADALRQAGVPIRVVEPGAIGIKAQIEAFHSCAGVIGVRGAEFANTFWSRPGTRVIMIKPSSMPGTPPILGFAKPWGLDFHTLNADPDEGNYPTLDPGRIRALLPGPFHEPSP